MEGYTISNPSNGIFDILFNVPLTEIYGISINIVDAYGYNGGNQGGSIGLGQSPDATVPGSILFTDDNAQVSFISDSILRVKTGNSAGTLSNRSFTFFSYRKVIYKNQFLTQTIIFSCIETIMLRFNL
ncbi:hypothetical protein [Chryseobacterium wanjuense]